MNATQYADFLTLVITIGIFAYLFYGPWQKFVVDATRQRLFEIRDLLFDSAREHQALESEAYRMAREIINAQIRYAQELDIFHLTFTALTTFGYGRLTIEKAAQLVDNVVDGESDNDLKAEIKAAMNQAFGVTSMAVIRRSLIAVTLLLPALAVLILAASTMDAVGFAISTLGAPIKARAYNDMNGQMNPF